MKITLLNKIQIADKLGQLICEADEIFWTVAWGTQNSLYKALTDNSKKIRKVIFGTHFYQTDPNLLQQFVDDSHVRVMKNDAAGTFHPKIYLFRKGEVGFAVIGSANFTNGGLNKNDEAATIIEGAFKDSFFQDVLAMVDGFWGRGETIKQDFVDNYRLQHKATEKHRRELQKNRKFVKPTLDAKNNQLRQWTWSEYVQRLKDQDVSSFDMRLTILRKVKQFFSKVQSFNDLTYDEKRMIAGTKIRKTGDDMDWLLFGSMVGFGVFQSLIRTENPNLAEAIDHIPLSGAVSREQYDQFVSIFQSAFEGEARTGGVPTASRLLAMKRPDTFICVDSENKKGLAKDLGFTPSTISFEKYWDEIIVPITESNWWQSDKPIGPEGLLWEGRTAMLDIIYFKEKTKK